MKAIYLCVLAMCVFGDRIPLFDEEVKILVHIGFKLSDALGRKCVRDRLALSCMLGTISCVEETALNGDKGIVIISVNCYSVTPC